MAILGKGRQLHGAVVTAVDPTMQSAVSGLADAIVVGDLASLEGDGFNVVLGVSLANILGVVPGDSVNVTVPRLTVTPLGLFPRSKRPV
jgi:lipoprotein-releasing system permease protein